MAKQLITLSDLRYKFMGAGVWTIINNESDMPQPVNNKQVCLVVGSSKIGHINRPFYIEKGDIKTFRALFGTIDKSLERKGSFFHRSAEIALKESAILAMNLIPLNNELTIEGNPVADADVAQYQSFSLDSSSDNSDKKTKLLASYYQKERFFVPSKEYLLATREIEDQSKLLSLVNLSNQKLSFIIKKIDAKRYDISVRDWYKDMSIPAYLNPSDFISDYFIEIIAVIGDYSASKYESLSVDSTFSKYFDKNGLISGQLENFLADNEVATKFRVSGSVIPNFVDKDGSNLSIDSQINSAVLNLGVICAIDEEQLDSYEYDDNSGFLDLVGHRLINNNKTAIDMLSYNASLTNDYVFDEVSVLDNITLDITSQYVSVTNISKKIIVTVLSGYTGFEILKEYINTGSVVAGMTTQAGVAAGMTYSGFTPQQELIVRKISKYTNQIIIELGNSNKDLEVNESYVDIDTVCKIYNNINFFKVSNENLSAIVAGKDSEFVKAYKSGYIKSGDKILINDIEYFIKITNILGYTNETYTNGNSFMFSEYYEIGIYSNSSMTTHPSVGISEHIFDGDTKFISTQEILSQKIEILSQTNSNTIVISNTNNNVSVGKYLVGGTSENPVLSRILSIKNTIVGESLVNNALIITCADNIVVSTLAETTVVEMFNKFSSISTNLNLFCLDGFNINQSSLPDKTNNRVQKIYKTLTETSIGDALVDPELVNFRYFIDTFNNGLEIGSKSYLTRFFKRRQKCLGLLNTPSAREFKKSTNPRFTNTPTAVNPLPEINVDYIVSGGNIDENPDWLYSLPNEVDGASFAGFFFPNINVKDSDGTSNSVPPAAFVSNAFMRKFGTVDEHKPAAGVVRGGVSGDGVSGVEYPMLTDEYRALIEFGINPIISKNGKLVIYGNETSYKKYISALNNLNVRDSLITFEIDTTNLIEPYVFDFNDDSMRSTLSTILRKYYDTMKDTYRIIDTYELIFDRSNNPDVFLEAGAAVVDTVVTFAGVARKFINRITIKGRAITSSSFIAV